MNDRWTRAEERIRQSTEERRYRRADQDWSDTGSHAAPGRHARHAAPDPDEGDWDAYEDTGVIPRYGEEYDDGYSSADSNRYANHPADQHGGQGYAGAESGGAEYAGTGYADAGVDHGGGRMGAGQYPTDPHQVAQRLLGDYGTGEYEAQGGRHGYPAGQHSGEFVAQDHAEDDYPDADYQDEDSFAPAAPPPRRGPQRRRSARGQQSTDPVARKQSARKQAGRKSARDTTGRNQVARDTTGRNQVARASGEQGARRKRAREGDQTTGRNKSDRSRRASRAASRKAAERKRRRRNLLYIAAVFVVLFAVAAVYAGTKLMGVLNGPEDYAGPPGPVAVVQVHPGDTASQIAQTMLDRDVVKSTGAFYQAAVQNSNMTSVQPGYYAIPTHSKGVDAVTALVTPDSRVGNVVISEGRRLHDSIDANTGSRNEGIYRKIAEASCVGTGPAKKCVTYEQLDAAGASTDLKSLGVPSWAIDQVRQVPDHTRQLEGLISAGAWDFDPSGTAPQILAQLVAESAHSYESTGLLTPNPAIGINLTPYQILIAASLVEREALPADMPKVARVIVNRLNVNMPLEFDSTVNYTLDTTAVATTDSDRAKHTPWNTYAMSGLPATPIASPSLGALRAMENPTAGPWLYFVTVDKQGTTLFTDSYSEHQRNIEKARQSGILDSGH